MMIHYEKLVHDYLSGLTTRLRNFIPAEDFLDLWVHDEDHANSILAMLEAAGAHGLKSVSINITSEDTMKHLDADRLRKSSESIGQISMEKTPEGMLIHFAFNRRITPLASLQIKDVPALYRLHFNYDRVVSCFNKELPPKSPLILVSASGYGVSLQALIDPARHQIEDIGHAGATTAVSKRLMDELCTLMRHKPINECHDHSVIGLEYLLRDRSQKRIPVGIITPLNTWDVFNELTVLVRELVCNYREKAGYRSRDNFYALPISSAWRSLTDAEKIEALLQSINSFCQERSIEPHWFAVKEIQHHFKVILDLHPELCRLESITLLELEAYLRGNLEPTLCIFREEEPDKNKMRWDKPAVKSQIPIAKVSRLQN